MPPSGSRSTSRSTRSAEFRRRRRAPFGAGSRDRPDRLPAGIGSLLASVSDGRQQSKVSYSYADLFRQRVFGLALGYSDGVDANDLRRDPMMKLATGRNPTHDLDLASRSSISRFENALSGRQVAEMGREFEEFVMRRLGKRHRKARVVILDFDSTVDPTHGAQQLSMFNGFYGTHCYLPLLGFVSIGDHAEQHLFHARPRPETVRCHRGAIPALRRAVALARRTFSRARIRGNCSAKHAPLAGPTADFGR